MDKNDQKEKLRAKAQELRQKALDAKKRVNAYAAQGRKQRITVLLIAGAVILLVCYLFFNQALGTESEYQASFTCNPKVTDCKKYESVLRLWRPYRDKAYNVPQDE